MINLITMINLISITSNLLSSYRSHSKLLWTRFYSVAMKAVKQGISRIKSNSQKFTMSIYLSRSFPRSNSSFQLSSGNALQVVPWQQVFGFGSTILASFLALAVAAWFWDWTDLLSLNLLGAIYWLFIYISMYMAILWRVSERTKGLFLKMKAALTQVKDKPSMIFFLNILSFVFLYGIIFICNHMLPIDKEIFVKILLIMGESSAIIFCFNSQNELSRFQAVFSVFLSYLTILILLDKFSIYIFVILFYLFLLVEFLIVEYKSFLSLNGIFFFLLLAYLNICPEILLWGSALVLQLIFLYLLRFVLFQNDEEESPNKSLFFSLLFLLLCIGDFRETGFHLQILFLVAGALVIYLCFLSKTGWEQVITSLSYIIINLIIGGVITQNTSVFLHYSIPYLIINVLIFFYLYVSSLKKKESLQKVFELGKVRIIVSKLLFLTLFLSYMPVTDTYSWICPWLTTFASQMAVLNLFLFFFEDEFFQTLGRKQTTFLSRQIFYGGAVFFFLLYPAAAFILLLHPLFVRTLYRESRRLWRIMFTKK